MIPANRRKQLLSLTDLLPVLALLAAGTVLFGGFKDGINSDGVSYLTLSKKYAWGYFSEAVNAYWSPLYSWLLAPGWWPGVDMLAFAKGLNLTFAVLGMAAWMALLNELGLSLRWRLATGLASLPLWLLFAFEAITPDVLLVLLMVVQQRALVQWLKTGKMRPALVWGLFGALGYLAKAYYFPFFLAQWAFTLGWSLLFSDQKRHIARQSVAALLIFSSISGLWIGVISARQGQFTLSAAVAYNQVKYESAESKGHLMETIGLHRPPTRFAVSIWEDISPYIPAGQAGPTLRQRLTDAAINLGKEIRIFHHKNLAFGVVVLLVCMYVAGRPRWNDPLIHLAVGAAIYAGGYLFILIMDRYLWWIPLLALGLAGYFFSKWNEKHPFNRIQAAVGIAFLIVSAGGMPAYQLSSVWKAGMEYRSLAAGLEADPGYAPGPMASDSHYYDALFIAFHLGQGYHGQLLHSGLSPTAAVDTLRAQGVRWLWIWEKDSPYAADFQSIQPLNNGPLVLDLHRPVSDIQP